MWLFLPVPIYIERALATLTRLFTNELINSSNLIFLNVVSFRCYCGGETTVGARAASRGPARPDSSPRASCKRSDRSAENSPRLHFRRTNCGVRFFHLPNSIDPVPFLLLSLNESWYVGHTWDTGRWWHLSQQLDNTTIIIIIYNCKHVIIMNNDRERDQELY